MSSTPNSSTSIARSGLWFVVVGAAATLTHTVVFALLHPQMWPELANLSAFCVAFVVSYGGHRFLSFAGSSTSVRTSFMRFLATALAGLALNTATLAVLTRGFGWYPMLALAVAIVLATGQTYVLGRYWAFKR